MIFWKFFSTNQYSKGSKKNNQYKTKQVSVSKKYFQYKTVQFNKDTLMVNAVQFKSENWIDLYWNPENQISNFYFVIVHLTNAFLLCFEQVYSHTGDFVDDKSITSDATVRGSISSIFFLPQLWKQPLKWSNWRWCSSLSCWSWHQKLFHHVYSLSRRSK